MDFAKRLRDGVRNGRVTCSVRIWKSPHVKVGNRYAMEDGEIEIKFHFVPAVPVTAALAAQ